jgi:hypothetical protein
LAYQLFIVAHVGLDVCDGAHTFFVMKKGHPMAELFEL